MQIVGLNLSHDSSVCLVEDGEVVAALALERRTRVKRGTVPLHLYAGAMAELIREVIVGSDRTVDQIDYWIATSTETGCEAEEKALPDLLGLLIPRRRWISLPHPGHHLAHASAGFYTSGFDEAAALIVDAYGSIVDDGREQESIFRFHHGQRPELLWRSKRQGRRVAGQRRGDSLWIPSELSGIGEVYRVVTLALGFNEAGTTYDDAGKTMGLAASGTRISETSLFIRADGNERCFSDAASNLIDLGLASPCSDGLLLNPRQPGDPLTDLHRGLARQIQDEFEQACLMLASQALTLSESTNLVLGGGCFLNSVANTRISSELGAQVYVFPAATDDGNAIGAALYGYHQLTDSIPAPRPRARLKSIFLGPARSTSHVLALASDRGLTATEHRDQQALAVAAAEALQRGEVIGWFRPRSEFGPRALGGRSVLAHPGKAGMRDRINCSVKFRESFRPFAAAVLEDHVDDWFHNHAAAGPFMLTVCPVRTSRRSDINEVVHTDGTTRIQTVSKDHADAAFRSLIELFHKTTGIPLILNTSFNMRGEPIMEFPEQAIDYLFTTRIERVFLGQFEIQAPDHRALIPRRCGARGLATDLSPHERNVYDRADGSATVEEIAEAIGVGADLGVDIILAARRRGLVEWKDVVLAAPLPTALLAQYTPNAQR